MGRRHRRMYRPGPPAGTDGTAQRRRLERPDRRPTNRTVHRTTQRRRPERPHAPRLARCARRPAQRRWLERPSSDASIGRANRSDPSRRNDRPSQQDVLQLRFELRRLLMKTPAQQADPVLDRLSLCHGMIRQPPRLHLRVGQFNSEAAREYAELLHHGPGPLHRATVAVGQRGKGRCRRSGPSRVSALGGAAQGPLQPAQFERQRSASFPCTHQ